MFRGLPSTSWILAVFVGLAAALAGPALAAPEENGAAPPTAEPDWLAGNDLQPTWAGGMGAIFENRCMGCHRPGGISPMSFVRYADAKKWTKQMRVTVSTRAMPPWPADRQVGHFSNSKFLTPREMKLFEEWAGAGFPKGDGEFPLTRDWSSEWSIGSPDAVFELPEYTVGEDTTEEIREHVIETHFPEDRWIVAAEALPGDEYTVLHIEGGALGSYYPGNSAELLGSGQAYLLAAGAKVPVRIFYRKEKGYEVTDQSRLAVKFADDASSIRYRVETHRMANTKFSIPAGAKSHEVSTRFELTQDAHIVSLLPVMQMRGQSVRYAATFPGGTTKTLLAIPEWDPVWKYRYRLAQPLAAPKGTVVRATAVYNNSADNLRNPDPTAAVKPGPGGELLEGWLGLASPVSMRADVPAAAEPKVKLAKFRLVHEEVNGSADSALSPDGKWFSFASRRAGNLDIWLVSTETGELRRVTDHPNSDYEARWHPDGEKLVFVTHRNGSQDVYLLDMKTGKETPIATESFNEDYPSFSKDGSEIVFTGGPFGFREVQVYNFATGEIRTLTKGYGWVGSTNFSPDGKSIVFHAYYDRSYRSGKSDVFIVPAQGGEVKNITHSREVWDYKAHWSYDGERIVFSSKRASPNFNLFTMKPDGSSLQQVTNVDGGDLRWANWTKDGRVGWHQINTQEGRIRALDIATGKLTDAVVSEDYVSDLSLSPDGDGMLYETDGKIFILPSHKGSEPRELTRGLRPRWSRDGERVSFLRYRRSDDGVPEGGMGTIAVDGEGPGAMAWVSHLTVAESAEPWRESTFRQAWSPDGKTLIKVHANGEKEDLVLVSQDGAERSLTRDGKSKSSPVWSADGKRVYYVENRPRSVGYYMTTEAVAR